MKDEYISQSVFVVKRVVFFLFSFDVIISVSLLNNRLLTLQRVHDISL